MLLPKCVCGSARAEYQLRFDIPTLCCTECGIVRQDVPMTQEELAAWYRTEYFNGPYYHSKAHDEQVAVIRLAAYLRDGVVTPTSTVLDCGSGNGAFVEVLRGAGIPAWGQDLAEDAESPFVYTGALEDIGFPTDAFDVVTVHDVLEHIVDPSTWLKELSRVCRPGGTLIVDFPRFWHDLGRHHWKPVQHLWMFDEGQLIALIESAGFDVERVQNPIESKVVVYATRRAEKRVQVLTPAGIGDTYWSLTKLPGLLRAIGHEGEIADVWVQDSGGPKRTEPFLRTIPTVHAAGYKWLHSNDPLFKEAYMRDARTVFPDVLGVDYFVAYNGVMRAGKRLEDVDTTFGVDWYPRMFVSKEALAMQAAIAANGPYAVVYVVGHGMYQHWLQEFSRNAIFETLRRLQQETGLRLVFVGAEWDKGSEGEALVAQNPSWVNLTGQTSYDQLLGVLRGASLVTGFPSGLTIMGAVLRRPTLLFWNHYFVEGFWKAACPATGKYETVDTYLAGRKPNDVVALAKDLMARG